MGTAMGPSGAPRRIRFGRALAVAGFLGLFVIACDSNTETRPAHNPVTVILDPTTVEDLLAAITRAGLAAPNPRDVTSRDCPQLGCTDKVDTDTVLVIKFPRSGMAESYASWTRDRFQVTDVVISFPASMPADQRTAYEDAVARAIE
jgi:hypothetical protein